MRSGRWRLAGAAAAVVLALAAVVVQATPLLAPGGRAQQDVRVWLTRPALHLALLALLPAFGAVVAAAVRWRRAGSVVAALLAAVLALVVAGPVVTAQRRSGLEPRERAALARLPAGAGLGPTEVAPGRDLGIGTGAFPVGRRTGSTTCALLRPVFEAWVAAGSFSDQTTVTASVPCTYAGTEDGLPTFGSVARGGAATVSVAAPGGFG